MKRNVTSGLIAASICLTATFLGCGARTFVLAAESDSSAAEAAKRAQALIETTREAGCKPVDLAAGTGMGFEIEDCKTEDAVSHGAAYSVYLLVRCPRNVEPQQDLP